MGSPGIRIVVRETQLQPTLSPSLFRLPPVILSMYREDFEKDMMEDSLEKYREAMFDRLMQCGRSSGD